MFSFIKKLFNSVPHVENAKVVDYVYCGDKASESLHEAIGAWSEKTPHKTSCYKGESNYIVKGKKTSVRNYAGETGVILVNTSFDNTSQDLLINLILYDTPYEVGILPQANKATTVFVSTDNENWDKIGSYILTYEDTFSSFIFKMPQFKGEKIYVKLDNQINIVDGQNHYGQSVHYIGLYKNES